MVYREETLLNVMKSVTRNGRSILLTALFAIILVYLFSIIGFIFFKDDFLVDADELVMPEVEVADDGDEAACDKDAAGCNATEANAAAKYGETERRSLIERSMLILRVLYINIKRSLL